MGRRRAGDLHARFGRAIRAARERAGLTQETAAADAGLHRVYWSEVERGLRDCRLSVLVKFARGLGVSASRLLAAAERADLSPVRDAKSRRPRRAGRKGPRRSVR